MTIFVKPEMGRHSYGSPIVKKWGAENAKCQIGAFCSIADNVQISLGGNHTTDWLTTFPFPAFFPKLGISYPPGKGTKGDVIIGNDVWLADNVSIMSGSIIEDGCAIGANAVVAGHIPAYSIVVGNPGKVIKKRFSDEQIEELLKIKWWDWPLEKILERASQLLSPNIDEFIARYKGLYNDKA
jgi:acetyltransferase-like isoleucine patch superfamily enzyme